MKRSKLSGSKRTLIHTAIRFIRGSRIILDTDLARVYGIPTFRLNEAVKRNRRRFPRDFMFQLSREEVRSLTSQIAMSNEGRGGRRTRPRAFTEHGAVMAANILKSRRAVQMSIFVVRAFIKMRETLAANGAMMDKLGELEKRLSGRLNAHEGAIMYVLAELKKLMEPQALPAPKGRPMGFGRGEDE